MVSLPLKRTLAESSDPDNPPPEAMEEIFETVSRIAVVGLSRDPTKPARRVPSYLAAKGFEILPVNPHAERILGRASVSSLEHLEEPVDMVVVFRPSSEAAAVVEQAAAREERPVIWLQEGIRADDAVAVAREAGLTVVQDLCTYKVHRALIT
jgi:predicted CoA-binding protein